MKVSLIIPAFNEEKYIKRCLDSVFKQTKIPDEIILINNNSADKTVSIAQKFDVKVINEKKQGMIHARNKGFNEAKFELIARIDADVILPKNWIAKVLDNFEKNKIDALSGPVSYYGSKLITKSPIPSQIYIESFKIASGGNSILIGPNMIITKKIWQKVKNKVNTNDKQVHEDVDLTLNIIKVGGKIAHDNNLIVKSSSRRIVNHPEEFFVEYPTRFIKTLLANK